MNEIDIRAIKSELYDCIKQDLKCYKKVIENPQYNHYKATYDYINSFNYAYNDICETSVRRDMPYSTSDLSLYFGTIEDENSVGHDILYQLLCAELYFVIVSIESVTTFNRYVPYTQKDKTLQKCWSLVKGWDNYYASRYRYNGHNWNEVKRGTVMSYRFTKNVELLKKFFENRSDVDTRSDGQKVKDTVQSGVESIVSFVVGIIMVIAIILLMAKCCGADVHPFG